MSRKSFFLVAILLLAGAVFFTSKRGPRGAISLHRANQGSSQKKTDSAAARTIPRQASFRPVASGKSAPGPNWASRRSLPSTSRFRNSTVIASRETLLENNEIVRVEILKTEMKYPFIRVESHLRKDPITGEEKLLVAYEAVADHVMVSLQPGKTEADLLAAIEAVHGTIRSNLELDFAPTYLVALPEPTLDAVPDAVKQLGVFKDLCRVVEPDGVEHASAVPNDPKFGQQWQFNNTGQSGGTFDADIDATEAWSIQTGSDTLVIALSDTGVAYNHTDLKENMWSNPGETPSDNKDNEGNGFIDDERGWNFYDNNNRPYDDVGHGTFVAGIIGARGNNDAGVTGVCWRCRILPVKTLGYSGGVHSDIAKGYQYARKMGAKIINASHGGSERSDVIEAAISELQSAGILLVTAAGNDGVDTDQYPHYPSSYANPNVISVGDSDDNDEISWYSNYGLRSVDVFAPGQLVYSTLPTEWGSYDYNSGTSFSAPCVTGVCGLLRVQHPEWTYLQIRASLLNNVEPKATLIGKCVSGGRLNAYKAFNGVPTLAQSLESPDYIALTTGGQATWHGQGSFTKDGVDAAASGNILDGQESWMEARVSGPGTIKFYWKISCEESSGSFRYDYMRFSIDGMEQDYIQGVVNWQQQSYSLSSGNHVLRWSYVKDDSTSAYQDRAWVDQLSFIGVAPTITITPAEQEAPVGATVSFSATPDGTPPFTYQWKKNGASVPGATGSALNLANIQSSDQGNYSVTVNNRWGSRTSSAALLKICQYTLSSSTATFEAEGGSGQFTVAVNGGCTWDVVNTNDWILTAPDSQTNSNAVVSYSVNPNPASVTRVGFLNIGNKTFAVTQRGDFAPGSVAHKTFTMTVTNGAGSLPTNSAFQVVLAGDTNSFRIFSVTNLATPRTSLDAGSYSYTNESRTNALLVLTGSLTNFVALTFLSPSSGTFSATNDVGELQTGNFTLLQNGPDFDNDGLSDVLWQNANNQIAAWLMNGTNFLGSILLHNGQPAGMGWRVFGVGDINGDSSADILFQHTGGMLAAWSMQGETFLQSGTLRGGQAASPGWHAVAAGDFNNDQQPDILFQHDNGKLAVWLMNGTNFLNSIQLRNGTPAGVGWRAIGLCDFNDDGQNDILFQSSGGLTAVWFMVGTQFINVTTLRGGQSAAPGWSAVAISDFNRDGHADILFQHDTGKLAAWFMNGMNFLGAGVLRNGQAAAEWRVVGPK